MTQSHRERAIRAAHKKTGFSENGPEKQETRLRLIAEANARSAQPPLSIFSFPGIEGHCVELFRKVWPDTRIVGIDRQMPPIRFTIAHFHPRQTNLGPIENELMHGALKDYADRQHLRLYRMSSLGQKSRVETFDFPKFNVMFLDTTARYDTTTGILRDAARMIDDHCAHGAVIGVTIVLGAPSEESPDIVLIVDKFCDTIKRETILCGDPMAYDTTAQMLFFILYAP